MTFTKVPHIGLRFFCFGHDWVARNELMIGPFLITWGGPPRNAREMRQEKS